MKKLGTLESASRETSDSNPIIWSMKTTLYI